MARNARVWGAALIAGSLASHGHAAEPLTAVASGEPPSRGVALGGYFGSVRETFLVGAQVTSPWFLDSLRLAAAGGAGFFPGALAAEAEASWTPFAQGYGRIEAGPDFFSGAPVRPYAFGGVMWAVLPERMGEAGLALGGLGGIGIEVGHWPTGGFTYGIEVAGVGSSAQATTPTGDESFLTGLLVNGSLRAYLW